MQPREWIMLVLLIAIPLAIAVVVTLWSIKQMAYKPKKAPRPKPVLSAEDLARLSGDTAEVDRESASQRAEHKRSGSHPDAGTGSPDAAASTASAGTVAGSRAGSV